MHRPEDDGPPHETTLTASENAALLSPVEEVNEPFPTRERDRYVFEGEHARGGLGRILRAFDRDLGRVVAVKELISAEPLAVERFAREARITARLEHPSIVPVHDVGQWSDGEPFYAMKLVSGQTLKDLVTDATEPPERLRLIPHVLAVAEAIAYAHSQGVLHRDLKPSNVLIGRFGETVVIDWGLAKKIGDVSSTPVETAIYRSEAGSALTRVGVVLGTPAYMPPEQARGEVVSERADVYALGALLYHTLAGVPPYRGEDSQEVLTRLLAGPPPRLDSTAIPLDLIAIVERAMARDPALRYADASAFAVDVKRYVTGQLVSAHSYRLSDLIRRWMRRNRALLLSSSIFVSVVVVLGIVSVWRIVREKRAVTEQRVVAEARRQEADTARRAAEDRSNQLVLMQAHSALARDPTSSIGWLKTYPTTGPEIPNVRAMAAEAFANGAADFAYQGVVWSNLVYAPDDRSAALLTTTGRALILDTATGKTIDLSSRPSPRRPFVWSPDGRWLLTVDLGEAATLFDTQHWQAHSLDAVVRASERNAAFSPDSKKVAIVESDGRLSVWDVESRRRIHELSCGTDAVGMALSADGSEVVTSQRAGLFSTNLTTGKTRRLIEAKVPGAGSVLRAEEGTFATATYGPNVYAINLRTVEAHLLVATHGRLLLTPGGGYQIRGDAKVDSLSHFTAVTALAISADGTKVASAADPDGVRVWDVVSGGYSDLEHATGTIRSLLFSRDGRWILGERADNVVVRWTRCRNGYCFVDELRLAGTGLDDLAVSRDGRRIMTVNKLKQLRQWTDRSVTHEGIMLLGWVADRRALYIGPEVAIYEASESTATARRLGTCPFARGADARLPKLAWSARTVACVGDDRKVRLLDVRSGELSVIDGIEHADSVWIIGPHVLALGLEGSAYLFDLDKQTVESRLVGKAAVVAEDGLAVAWPVAQGISLWNMKTGIETLVEASGAEYIWLLERGEVLAWRGIDGTLHIHGVDTGLSHSALSIPQTARPLALSPGGRYLVTGDPGDGSKVWDLMTGDVTVRMPEITGAVRFFGADTVAAVCDHKLVINSASTGTNRWTFDTVDGIDVSKEGELLAFSRDGQIMLLDLVSHARRTLPGEKWIARAAFSPDGRYVASDVSSSLIRIRPDDLPREPVALLAEIQTRSSVGISQSGLVTGTVLDAWPYRSQDLTGPTR
jgi:WD40 repeat protein